jgi:hypothetical protein
MASAHFSRCEQARFWVVAQAAKPSDDVGKSQIDVAFDVLDEHGSGPHFADDPLDFGPQVPGIGFSAPLSGHAERLARISGSEDMNLAAPWAAVEGSEIVPDRRMIQGRVCHPGHESGRCMGLPLDETDSAISGLGDREAKLETAITGAEGKAGEGVDISGMNNHKRGLRRRSSLRSRRAHRPQLIDLAAAPALDLDRACQCAILCLEQQRVASAAPKRLLHRYAPITAPPSRPGELEGWRASPKVRVPARGLRRFERLCRPRQKAAQFITSARRSQRTITSISDWMISPEIVEVVSSTL